MSHKLPSGRRASRTLVCRSIMGCTRHAVMQYSHQPSPSITLASSSIPPRGSQKPQKTQPGRRPQKRREWEIMELCVSTTASSIRATAAPAAISFAPLRRGASASTALPLHRRIPTRGWRCASAAVPDPAPSDGPASATYTYVFTDDKPDTPADDKVEEASAAPSGSAEAPVAELVSSEASPSPSPDGGLGEILSKLNIEVTPTLILTGSGAFLALWILSSVVAAIDSVPLLPKLLELVGTGYSVWFIARNLLFKENRDDMFAKFEDLIQRII